MADILFLAHRLPWPPDRGDKIRSHWLLRKLAELGPVHLGCFSDDANDEAYLPEVNNVCASLYVEQRIKPQWRAGLEALASGKPVSLTSFASDGLAQWVERTIADHEIEHVLTFSGQMAQFLPADYAGRFVMDFADVDSAKFEQYGAEARGPMAWINRREGRLLGRFETEVARRADMSTFVSEAEAELFRQRSGIDAERIAALGNGIDSSFYDPAADNIAPLTERPDGPLLVFTGQMDYRPNVEAVCWYADHVVPQLRRQFPSLSFAVVGRAPVPAVRALGERPGIHVTGAVHDVRSWLAAADIVVAPLLLARGIQNKVLEAMAMARPVIASRAAAEGISASHGEHLMIAADANEQIAMAAQLLNDSSGAAELGKAARRQVIADYGWDARLAPIAEMLFPTVEPVAEAAE